jgi:hypothetical protein
MPASEKNLIVAKQVHQQMIDYLNMNEPKLMLWLTNLWEDQTNAITYKQIRQMLFSGTVPPHFLDQWQKDYSKLVTEKFHPEYLNAMAAAAQTLTNRHPDFVFDRNWWGVHDWLMTEGAALVKQLSSEQHEALQTIIARAGALDIPGLTVDQLSRTIRPVIGLHSRFATAVHNYGLTLFSNGVNPAKVHEMQFNYAARLHRYRAFTIGRHELGVAYIQGADYGIEQAQFQGLIGVVEKVWSTSQDERVCPICKPMNGQRVAQSADFTTGNGRTVKLAPAHVTCRCGVMYEEVEGPGEERKLTQAPDIAVPEPPGQIPIPEPEPTKAPDNFTGFPSPDQLKLKGALSGATGGNAFVYAGPNNQEWIFKRALAKGSKTPEPYRAYASEAAYKVGGIIDPESAQPIGTITINGEFGTIQKMLQFDHSLAGLDTWQKDGVERELSPHTKASLLREHVTDWLIGNFDAHGRNFVWKDGGVLVGIDKEQAFKYIMDPASEKMSFIYHPNSKYGELEPIYNTLFRRFAEKKIDLDLQDTLTYLKRIEAVPDYIYREIWRGYAEAVKGKGKEAEALLNAIVERKQNLRTAYRHFYSELLTQRSGRKVAFMFADEGPEHMDQALSAVMQSPESLAKLPLVQLKEFAKSKQIAYYSSMSKSQLITAISDPGKAAEMSAQVKARLQAAAALRRAAAKEPIPALPSGLKLKVPNAKGEVYYAEAVFSNFDHIPPKATSLSIWGDGNKIEGMNVHARRTIFNGQEYVEIYGKLTEPEWMATINRAKNLNLSRRKFDMRLVTIDNNKAIYGSEDLSAVGQQCHVLRDSSGNTFELVDQSASSEARAYMGMFRVRVKADFGDGEKAANNAKSLFNKMGLGEAANNPASDDEERYKLARLIWRENPAQATKIGRDRIAQMPIQDLRKQAQLMGINPSNVKKLQLIEVMDGYATYIDPGYSKALYKEGARYIWSGVPNENNVVNILKSPGMLSTNRRLQLGINGAGSSVSSDIRRGGADNVFLRLGIPQKIRFSSHFGDGRYQLHFDLKELDRTDVYFYKHDTFGSTEPGYFDTYTRSPIEHVKSLMTSYNEGNEVMLRHGIRNESLIKITCANYNDKMSLIHELQKAGITEVNGKKLDQLIEVTETLW